MKRFLVLASLVVFTFGTPKFQPVKVSPIYTTAAKAGQEVGHTIGSQIPVNVDVSEILNRKLAPNIIRH